MGPLDSNAVPLSPRPPLRQLWEHADRHRPKVVLATIFSVLNKICDIAPELLIGAAVDVVVDEGQSFIGAVFGVEDRYDQLDVLAIITVIVWVLESITDYIAEVLVAEPGPGHRARDADGRVPATSRSSSSPTSRTAPRAGSWPCSTTTSTSSSGSSTSAPTR